MGIKDRYPRSQGSKGARMRTVTFFLCLALGLTACARITESRLNPFNWFGPSQRVVATPVQQQVRPLVPEGAIRVVQDRRTVIDRVIDVRVNRTPTGAIVEATGVAATQGYFHAELVPVSLANGTLTYDFRVEAPPAFEVVGSEFSRRITAAERLDRDEVAAIRRVVVRGARESRSASR